MKQIALICLMAAVARADAAPSIAGVWLFGTGAEPGPGPYRYSEICGARAPKIDLVARGGVIEARVDAGAPMHGGAQFAPPPYSTVVEERLEGTFDGERLVLRGARDVRHQMIRRGRDPLAPPAPEIVPPADVHEPVSIELRYRARTGHFVGTRNGVALWLARGKLIPQKIGGCPP